MGQVHPESVVSALESDSVLASRTGSAPPVDRSPDTMQPHIGSPIKMLQACNRQPKFMVECICSIDAYSMISDMSNESALD